MAKKPPKAPPPDDVGHIQLDIRNAEPEPDENASASWTGHVLLRMDHAEAVAIATDILLGSRNAVSTGRTRVEIWLPPSTVRVYRSE